MSAPMSCAGFIYYSYQLALKIEFQGRALYDCGGRDIPDPELQPTLCRPTTDLRQALRLQTDPNEWPWEAICLVAMLVGFRVLVYVALRLKTRT
jgi:hypothetical protein